MDKYNLQPNEFFILKNEYVRKGSTNGELILTNLNLVFITSKGVFKTTFIPQLYPIKQIKVFDGKAQAILGKDGKVDIHFISGIESFKLWNSDTFFSDKKAEKEAERLVNEINRLITGEALESDISVSTTSVATEVIAGTIKDTFDILKGTLGVKSKNNNEIPTKSAKKCSFCGAQISGIKGQVVSCQYCDGEQQL